MTSGTLAPEQVRSMFDRIAPVYDGMNRAMTLGLDRKWRRLTAEAVVRPGDRVLDACCGTGDLALAAARAGGRVTGVDFSAEMLARAERKAPEFDWVQADASALPFPDAGKDDARDLGDSWSSSRTMAVRPCATGWSVWRTISRNRVAASTWATL